MTEQPTRKEIAKMIDHSLLHPTLTDAEIRAGCALAARYGTAAVCVKPYAVRMARAALKDSGVGVCSVVAFPHGNSIPEIKAVETLRAVEDGATEIDMVINVGKALGGDGKYVAAEIGVVNAACAANGAILKVIFETDYLQEEHIVELCRICSTAKVAFVKTSSGYGFVKQSDGLYAYKGATEDKLKLMRRHCAPEVRLKAAGGIRTLDALLRMRAAGADRIGTAATGAILESMDGPNGKD